MKILCITGQKRSGKDTALEFIANNKNIIFYKLAHEIKEAMTFALQGKYTYSDIDGKTNIDRECILELNKFEIEAAFSSAVSYLIKKGLPTSLGEANIHGFVKQYPENSWSIRTFMQRLGTDFVCNCCDKLFWVRLAIKYYSEMLNDKTDYFIIPDVRQDWEIDSIRDLGGLIIHVKRDGINKNTSPDEHSTEKSLPIKSGDIIIDNNSSLEDFYKNISKYI